VPLRLLTSVGQCREAGLESVSYVWQVDRLDSIMTAVEEELKKRGAPLEERA
jgi:diphthamide synthase (EF-2-diphthine--ammonia ligase)